MGKVLNVLLLIPVFIAFSCTQNTIRHTMKSKNTMDIKVLGIKGCEATSRTIELVKSVSQSMDIHIALDTVIIESQEQAQNEHFIGSPTVKINGLDIEPEARDAKFFGVT